MADCSKVPEVPVGFLNLAEIIGDFCSNIEKQKQANKRTITVSEQTDNSVENILGANYYKPADSS